uniref:Phosphoglycerate mutase family protein n=1 Tax=Denticeps clupeoides TaxID=299321 RepID=A0AAY4BI98_9TELE
MTSPRYVTNQEVPPDSATLQRYAHVCADFGATVSGRFLPSPVTTWTSSFPAVPASYSVSAVVRHTDAEVLLADKMADTTAEIILRNNVHSADVELVSDALLRERPAGSRVTWPTRPASPAGTSPPGGETTEQVRKRFRKFLKSLFQRMATDHGFPEAGADVAHPAAQDEDGLGQLHAHALVVSHGAYIRVAVRHLVEELQCSLPPGSRVGQVFGACPNTGMCRFVVTLSRGETGPQPHAVHCLFVNRKEHLDCYVLETFIQSICFYIC